MTPKAFIFDLDDTLLDIYGQPEAAWRAVVDEFPALSRDHDVSDIVQTIVRIREQVWNAPSFRVEMSRDIAAARRHVVSTAFAELGIDDPALAVRVAQRFTMLRDQSVALHPGAKDTLRNLKMNGHGLAMLTNGGAITQRAKIDNFGLAPFFDHILIEGELGVGKPDRRAFELAVRRLGVTASETWMVGDNLEWDIAGAQALGMFAIWFNPQREKLETNGRFKPNAEIAQLEEILDLTAE